MPAVFVHGNPETAAVWRPLLAELGRTDALTLSPPGFGGPLPPGFGATCDDYLEWLVTELESIGEPVDLVGHDWGATHALRLACRRPDLIRSWCSDTAGAWAPDYVWHEISLLFRTPGAGEEVISGWLAMEAEGRTIIFQPPGMAPDVVSELAAAIDEDMGKCILGTYRSADTAAWRELLPEAAARPGLVLAVVEMSSEAPRRSTAGSPNVRERRSASSTKVTGGCCRTRRPELRRSRCSGPRSDDPQALSRHSIASRTPADDAARVSRSACA